MSNGKLDAIMTALASMSLDRDQILKENKELNLRLLDLDTHIHNAIGQVHAAEVSPLASLQQQAPTTSSNEAKEPQISPPEKFDGIRSKFSGFVNQVRLITILQPQRYSTDATCVGLVGTLLTGQTLSWFAPLFEKNAAILSNCEAFLGAFNEAFDEHDKIRLASTKIRSLRQGTRSALNYASKFWQLTFDINWDELALISQFYFGLQDGVKDLLLTLPSLSTLDKVINQAMKCENRLFERRQDKQVWTTTHQPSEYSASSTSAHDVKYTKAEAMQIDATKFKPLTEQEKKRRREENLCLYCGQPGHLASNCPLKRQRTFRMRTTTIHQENDDVQSQ